jgi:hypothetical protein
LLISPVRGFHGETGDFAMCLLHVLVFDDWKVESVCGDKMSVIVIPALVG